MLFVHDAENGVSVSELSIWDAVPKNPTIEKSPHVRFTDEEPICYAACARE